MTTQSFPMIIQQAAPDISASAVNSLNRYRELVLRENEVQNLTRLTAPRDFWEGLVIDGYELLKSGLVEFPAIDLGTGGGVPGVVSAILSQDSWLLVDS